jgi:tetratricopeptide (TPR) repeat protein
MSPSHLPLQRLTSTHPTNGREALAAQYLRALDPAAKLTAEAMAHIEQVLGSHPLRARGERLSSWRLLRAGALVIAILLTISGAASAAYYFARSLQRVLQSAPEIASAHSGTTPALRSEPALNNIEEAPPLTQPGNPVLASPAPSPHRPLPHTPPRVVQPVTSVPNPSSLEHSELELGLAQKNRGEFTQAVATLDRYRREHPESQFVGEAALAELDAQLRLGRRSDALALLRNLGEAQELPRWDELRLLRAELESEQGECADALRVFEDSSTVQGLAERALYGRALCLQKLGRVEESRRAFAAFLERYPEGRRAVEARRALGTGN